MSWLLSAVIVVVVVLGGGGWVGDWISHRAAARRHADQTAQRAVVDAQRMEESYRVLDQRARELADLPIWTRKTLAASDEHHQAVLDEQRGELIRQIGQDITALVFRPTIVRDTAAELAAVARNLGEVIKKINNTVSLDTLTTGEPTPEEKAPHDTAVAALHAARDRFIAAARLDLGVAS